jgi:hypothetical protein
MAGFKTLIMSSEPSSIRMAFCVLVAAVYSPHTAPFPNEGLPRPKQPLKPDAKLKKDPPPQPGKSPPIEQIASNDAITDQSPSS